MNNDRFKFRVAVKQGLEWQIYDVLNILFKKDGSIWVQTIRQTETVTFSAWFQVDGENVILEQCTGLTDKNGKLIFQGDVITTAEDDQIPKEYEIYCIKWEKAYSGELFCAINVKGELEDFYGGIPLLEYARIIGNIHQMEVEK